MTNISGSMFDMAGGPDLKGTWKNFRTGEIINIKDTVIEDNQLVGIASNGAMVPYAKLQNCIKCDSEKDAKQMPTMPKSKPTHRAPAKQFVDNIDNDNYGDAAVVEPDPLTIPINNKPKPKSTVPSPQAPAVATPESTNAPITTVLNGLSGKEIPKIDVDIKWGGVPEGIIFLNKYLNISAESISDAIIKKFVNIDEIKDKLTSKVKATIEKGLTEPKEQKTKKGAQE